MHNKKRRGPGQNFGGLYCSEGGVERGEGEGGQSVKMKESSGPHVAEGQSRPAMLTQIPSRSLSKEPDSAGLGWGLGMHNLKNISPSSSIDA